MTRGRGRPRVIGGIGGRAVAVMLAAALAATAAPVAAQDGIRVTVPGAAPVTLGEAALAALPRDSATGTAHGRTHRYVGVPLAAVLRAAGLAATDSLRDRALRLVVVAEGRDGYAAAFALGELDRSLAGRRVLVADREDGAAIGGEDGPRRLVVPGDGRPARWVRQLASLRVLEVP